MRKIIFFLLLIVYFPFSTAEASAQTPSTKTINFTPSSDDFANPERGFMKQSSIYLDQNFDPGKIKTISPTDTLVWIYFRLDNYRSKPLDSHALSIVSSTFNEARLKGLKLVVRFIYNPGPGSTKDKSQMNPDAPISQVLEHISQLKPILTENSDVLAALQAGFAGHFGEWHSSYYDLNSLTNSKLILDALLDAIPPERMIQIRYPRFKETHYGGPIPSNQAYSKTATSRIGFHDDAFLKDDTDDGTFKSTSYGTRISNYCNSAPLGETGCWRNYVSQDGRFTPVGGEASLYNPPRSSCENALTQLENLRWSFINNGFNAQVLSSWSSEGCMAEIRKRLGYRYYLSKAILPDTITPGKSMLLHLEIINEGFANMYNVRPSFIVFENMSTGDKAGTKVESLDPRLWQPKNIISINTIEAVVDIPTNLTQGLYRIYLWLPDASPHLQANPKYAVRFANTNTWDSTLGYNLITDNIKVGDTPQVSADVNGDGKVNIIDIGIIIDHYLENPITYGKADLNKDGAINIIDIGIVINNYQP